MEHFLNVLTQQADNLCSCVSVSLLQLILLIQIKKKKRKKERKKEWQTCRNQAAPADFCSVLLAGKMIKCSEAQASGNKRQMFVNNKYFPLSRSAREPRPPAQQEAAQVFRQTFQPHPEEDGRPVCLSHSASIGNQAVSYG